MHEQTFVTRAFIYLNFISASFTSFFRCKLKMTDEVEVRSSIHDYNKIPTILSSLVNDPG